MKVYDGNESYDNETVQWNDKTKDEIIAQLRRELEECKSKHQETKRQGQEVADNGWNFIQMYKDKLAAERKRADRTSD